MLAEHLQSLDFVEVCAHHDADGIAAAAILCTALSRCHIPFHLRVLPAITADQVPPDRPVLLCDFGSSFHDLADSAMVIDHHIPLFTGEFHVNPRLHGIDGDRELSTSGAAYFVAEKMGDNRDLAGLALLGVIGDRQEYSGPNREILNQGIGHGIISTRRGCTLPGRELFERLFLSTDPYLPSVTGNEDVCRELAASPEADLSAEEDPLFLSRLVLSVGDTASAEALLRIYGDAYALEREVVPDAPTLAALVDACGKSGHGGLAASLCLGDSSGIPEAWDHFKAFRERIIAGIRSVTSLGEGWYRLDDPVAASDIADILSHDCLSHDPIFVLVDDGGICRVSARAPPDNGINLGDIVKDAAAYAGGSGGGHNRRAGAMIPQQNVDVFRKAVMEAGFS
ncbi:single-stranded DNA-specific DHH superfamily exonuclease [Methanocalculus alkaliphilus]|uniref:DHH family phosphoesterase n=1 Tax=Methanocalculus alkaliphilus TaxID=768730 RepID=UPI00209CB151|nr:DHHA1 domain-containing protein [Methanocalculus alkaliphilus]MCP1715574.1 single-stranded DNA-specific DHH superfamily exonuclease [Methanocalculus alkaliphilus]